MLTALHAALAGGWIAALLASALAARAAAGQGRGRDLALARLRWTIAKGAQLPLLVAVAVSGAKLLRGVPLGDLLRAKLACAALAVFAGLYAIWLARLRLTMAEAGAWSLFAMIDRRQHQVAMVAILGLFGAMGLALVH